MTRAVGPGSDDLLHVVMNGRIIGDIQQTGGRIRLRYAGEEAAETFTPLSVSMPGPAGRYRDRILTFWLEGLLPDRPETLRQWRRRFGIADQRSVFPLFRHIGEDVAGAAQFVRPERLTFVLGSPDILLELSGDDVAEMLRRAIADLPVSLLDDIGGKFSLAGAQAKIALHRAGAGWSDPAGAVPSTHILKPAIADKPDQDLTEVVTMRAAAGLGLIVARCSVEQFGDERAIVVERYDRVPDDDGRWWRVHQEDMCQALGVWPRRKYESQGGPGAVAIADLIHRTSRRPNLDNQRFAEALVFNWLVCGTDAHARNYSLLLSGDSTRLAPLYDLNSHLAFSDGTGNDLSMSVLGTYRASAISQDDWRRFAPSLRVDPGWLDAEVDRQSAGLLDAMAAAAGADDIARYQSPVVARLLDNVERWRAARAGATTIGRTSPGSPRPPAPRSSR